MSSARAMIPFVLLAACHASDDVDIEDSSDAGTADLGRAVEVLRGGPLRMPVEAPSAIDSSTILGVDHNRPPNMLRIVCQNYAGQSFPFCYAGHEGTDFLLLGGFKAMDAGSAYVVAAAPGRVVEVEDGNYDRCHASVEIGDVSCDGYPMRSNHVVIEHADHAGRPLRTEYHHMMKGSIAVAVGMTVDCGQRLGRIGSSGRSSLPHLHLNVLQDGEHVDPYAGPYSQKQTFWIEQPAEATVLPPAECRF